MYLNAFKCCWVKYSMKVSYVKLIDRFVVCQLSLHLLCTVFTEILGCIPTIFSPL